MRTWIHPAHMEVAEQTLSELIERGAWEDMGCRPDCTGYLSIENVPEVACSLRDAEACPYYEQRAERVRRERLHQAGFPRHAQEPVWSAVAEDMAVHLRRYADSWPTRRERGDGIILAGGTGAGKTCALALLAATAIADGADVRYVHASLLFDELHHQRGIEYRDAEVLVVDDLGTEYPSEFAAQRFGAMVEARHARDLVTWIGTNLPGASLRERYGDRIMDRLRERCATLVTAATSQRRTASVDDWSDDDE